MKLWTITDKDGNKIQYVSEVALDWAALGLGKDAYTETIPATDTTPEHYIQHAAEYTVEVQDITAQIAAEQAQIDAIKQAQLNSAAALQALPTQIDACADLESLKALIKQFVVNVATLLQG